MKTFLKYTLAAGLAAGVAAEAPHHHHHHHAKKNLGSKVAKRAPDVVTAYVAGPTETVFQLGDKVLDFAAAKAGLDHGEYVIIGETTPTFSPPPPPPPSTTASQDLKAQFVESKSLPPPPPTTSSKPPPPPSPAPKPPPQAPKAQAEAVQSSSGATGLNAEFPSGKIRCTEFPSQYGAVALDWLGMNGWAGLQFVPGYTADSLSISDIITGISGQNCGRLAMCSYGCPPGYQKTQWSKAQGSTKQSIGGLYCNADGFLELTRDGSKTLCEPGAGGVSIQNDLDELVSTCRTDYPGTESMVLPAVANAGQTIPLCNPDQSNYYVWNGMSTSAQYYVNKKGIAEKDACVWNSPIDPEGAGNWSPMIVGVGKATDGITYISIFPNLPTSTAQLDFNIEITGDISGKCSYVNGQWTGGNNGCTTGMRSGGKAVIRYF